MIIECKLSEYLKDLFALLVKEFDLQKVVIEATPDFSYLLKAEKCGYSVFIEVYEDSVSCREFYCKIYQGKTQASSFPIFKSAIRLHDNLLEFFKGV